MKCSPLTLICTAIAVPALMAAPSTENPKENTSTKESAAAKALHLKRAKNLSLEQDDLSADVQDLIDEQTSPKVAKLLSEIEITMADVTDLLEQTNTGGATIAAQTEVIEKIFAAAKKKQKQSGGPAQQNMDPMLQMMQNMMNGGQDVGKKPGEGQKPGDSAGEGSGGGGKGSGAGSGKTGSPDNTDPHSQRRVPKNSGNSGGTIPREFQKAMDAYNKGAQDSVKKK